MNFKEAEYLLCTYLIIQDLEIHSNELKLLNQLYPNISNDIVDKSKNILSDDLSKVDLEDIYNILINYSSLNKKELIQNLLEISISDFYLDPKEIEFIKIVATKLNYDIQELSDYIDESEKKLNLKYEEKKQGRLSDIKERFAKLAYDLTGGKEFFEDKLLNGKEFVKKIKNISKKAYNDLELSKKKMGILNHYLQRNFDKLKISEEIIVQNERKEANELLKFIKVFNSNNRALINNSIKDNINLLEKKQHNIDYFTIAFLGKSKAGKSTFHKVVTGEKTDDIGIGKLRTTRYNRTFNWENIRIIDTPGINAPGGMKDTETARSIIDEADLICYIVTNDAIQETEFNFLKELKQKNKPVFIILNYKENIEDKTRLNRFLKKPLDWKDNEGQKNIQGHINRIKDMISKNYNPDLIEIIPVHLLAAKLAEENNNSHAKSLLLGSNINEYNKKVKQTIFRYGHLKKTQNIIDGCNYQSSIVLNNVTDELDKINIIIKNLKNSKDELIKFISKNSNDKQQLLKKIIENTHLNISNDISNFAEINYEKKDIQKAWKDYLEYKGYYKNMEINIKAEIEKFKKELENRAKEIMQDLSMNLGHISIPNVKVDTTNYKFIGSVTFGIITTIIGGLAVANVWNPVGWTLYTIMGASALVTIFISLMESKETKIKKAKQKITETIRPQIDKQKENITNEIISKYKQNIEKINIEFNKNFSLLINTAEDIKKALTEIQNKANENTIFFNKVLVYRILEHFNKIDIQKNTELDHDILDKIMNDYIINRQGEILTIKSKLKINQKEQEDISKIIQLDINFTN